MIKIEQGWLTIDNSKGWQWRAFIGRCSDLLQHLDNRTQVNFSSRQHGLPVLPTCLEPRYEVTLARRSSLHQRKFVQVVESVRLRMIGRLALESERTGKSDKNKHEEDMVQVESSTFSGSPGDLNWRLISSPISGNSSQAYRTGAVVRPSLRSTLSGFPSVVEVDS